MKAAEKIFPLVYPLADILQMDLTLHEQNGKFKVYGSQEFTLETAGLDFDLAPTVKASGVSKKDAWILVHVVGELWFFLSSLDSGEVYLWMLNGAKGMAYEQGWGLDMISSKLRPACFAVYARNKNKEWRQLDAGGVEQRQRGGVEEERRQAGKRDGTAQSS